VSSDEFYSDPRNERQREVEARLLAMADELGGRQGLDRRRFFQTAAGSAVLMGTLIKGLGVDRVCWGTDALWTDSPQWQIEGLRRLEIPEEMQKKHGLLPAGSSRETGQDRNLRRQQRETLRN
jgi:hypothetical protein